MIEKNIFQSWFTLDVHPVIKNKIEHYKKLNPDFIYNLYTDEDMDNFVNEHYPGEIAECYNKLNIIVAKVDFWRYLVLYKYGGVYLDMDSSIEKPLNELINDDDTAIITAEGNPDKYVQWALIFSKGHPILKKTIELVIDNINNNSYPNDIFKMTGPIVYSKAINEIHTELFGNIIIHKEINKDTDITYKSKNISYRLYGKDYNTYFRYKHEAEWALFHNKKKWNQEQKEIPLVKGFTL